MTQNKIFEWVLRIAIAGTFIGHGAFALQGKQAWVPWVQQFIPVSNETAVQILFLIGLLDLCVAVIVLFKPIRVVLLWAVIWGFWTGLLRPLVGEPIWDFIERWANWGAPLALLLYYGWPKQISAWLKVKD